MARRVRSSPKTASVILSVSVISITIIGGVVLFQMCIRDRQNRAINKAFFRISIKIYSSLHSFNVYIFSVFS